LSRCLGGYCPFQKKTVFSHIRGNLGLKLFKAIKSEPLYRNTNTVRKYLKVQNPKAERIYYVDTDECCVTPLCLVLSAAKRPPVEETASFLQSLLASHGPNYLEKLFGSKARDALEPLGGVEKVAIALSGTFTPWTFTGHVEVTLHTLL
jgi:hypothetical protein